MLYTKTFAEEELKGLMEEIMSEDLNRWNKADRNKDSKLSQDEFLSFQHPEHNEQSIEAMAEDLMSQMDDDSDLVNNIHLMSARVGNSFVFPRDSGNFVFFVWICLDQKLVYNANYPFSLRTHDTHVKRVRQRLLKVVGFLRVLWFPPTGNVYRVGGICL